MIIPQEGSRLKYRPTGRIFEVKKITDQFVILSSMDDSIQIMTGKNSFTFLFKFEEAAQPEVWPQDVALINEGQGTADSSQMKLEWAGGKQDCGKI
jgi:hypothetical protein